MIAERLLDTPNGQYVLTVTLRLRKSADNARGFVEK
ncbi:hypothetical protein EDD30_5312 [Couchioplanes caeruleus]|uniref:Uncharacterized protein n=1 Tax=Couchioplanes caeruleus TaxID=56438 RepID=A0A3N1GQ61_9ACTN|nr:hypothetical protein EDD30_5312 [Couchioplanes caeruleus]